MDTVLHIDPEFEGKIPPLTEEEFKKLEELIIEDGEVIMPIIVWNGTIVDGHNRWKILQIHPDIPYKIKEMAFADKWEAFAWMYKNQLGRRNLTDKQKSIIRAEYYNARKHTHGGNRGNQHSKVANVHSGLLPNEDTRSQVAKELGVGTGTINRDIHFAAGIEAIREEDQEFADSILNDETKVTSIDVQFFGKQEPEVRKELLEKMKSGEKLIKRRDFEKSANERMELEELENIASGLFRADAPAEITIDELLNEIRNNTKPYISLLHRIVARNIELCRKNKDMVIQTIQESITLFRKEIEKEINEHE